MTETKRVAYDDVDADVLQLFEQPTEWFECVLEQFYLSAGGVGQVKELTPNGVTFRRSHYKGAVGEFFESLCEEYANNTSIGDATVRENKESVRRGQEQATWMKTEDNWFWVYEHVPFNERVTDAESLQAELEEIMATTPDFAELFDAIESTCV